MSLQLHGKQVQCQILLTPALHKRLTSEGKKRGMSRSAFVRHALQSHFNVLDAAAKRQAQ